MEHIEFTARLDGETANILKKLVERGFCASKTEAIRTALIHYALRLGFYEKNSKK
ncbi:MAG: ribbon-helix-helix protein, CopG family [Candidatus Micrarchaeota archaeon]|nr:ribbon-helix-helix protein, CopG family [Candidatus Micrarchaeota archaeon]